MLYAFVDLHEQIMSKDKRTASASVFLTGLGKNLPRAGDAGGLLTVASGRTVGCLYGRVRAVVAIERFHIAGNRQELDTRNQDRLTSSKLSVVSV